MRKFLKIILFLALIYLSILQVFKAYAIDTTYNKIHVNLNFEVYQRSNFELKTENYYVREVKIKLLKKVKMFILSHGYSPEINSITYGHKRSSVLGHFDINFTIIHYPNDTLTYMVSKRCDGDVYHSWAAWDWEKTIDILINDWDDEVLYPSLNKLKKCPLKFKAIQSD